MGRNKLPEKPQLYFTCEWCGEKQKTKRVRKHPFCNLAHRRLFVRWMRQHRRIIADGWAECASPNCKNQFPLWRDPWTLHKQVGCCQSHAATAGNLGIITEPWAKRPKAIGKTAHETTSWSEMHSIQATQCQQLYTYGKRPCSKYVECLNKEFVKKGAGFKANCKDYTETVTTYRLTSGCGLAASMSLSVPQKR